MVTVKRLLYVVLISLSVVLIMLLALRAAQMLSEYGLIRGYKRVLGFQVLNGSVVFSTNIPEKTSPYWHEPVAADVATFEAVGPQEYAPTRQYYYGRDAKNVFIAIGRRVNMLRDCDPATFEILTLSGVFARDATNVYYAGFKIADADASTFEVLGRVYSKDAHRVYMGTFVVSGADPDSFHVLAEGASGYEHLGHSYPVGSYRDLATQSYNEVKTVGCWACDAKQCYFADLYIEADPKTFRVLNEQTAVDGERTIHWAERITRIKGK